MTKHNTVLKLQRNETKRNETNQKREAQNVSVGGKRSTTCRLLISTTTHSSTHTHSKFTHVHVQQRWQEGFPCCFVLACCALLLYVFACKANARTQLCQVMHI